jgi:hypothetical protein
MGAWHQDGLADIVGRKLTSTSTVVVKLVVSYNPRAQRS